MEYCQSPALSRMRPAMKRSCLETYIGVIKPMIVTQWISVHVVVIPTCSRIFFLENAITILVVCGVLPWRAMAMKRFILHRRWCGDYTHRSRWWAGYKICQVLGKSDLYPAIGKDDVGIDGRNYKAIYGYCHAVVGRYIVALDVAIKIYTNVRSFSRSLGNSKWCTRSFLPLWFVVLFLKSLQ